MLSRPTRSLRTRLASSTAVSGLLVRGHSELIFWLVSRTLLWSPDRVRCGCDSGSGALRDSREETGREEYA